MRPFVLGLLAMVSSLALDSPLFPARQALAQAPSQAGAPGHSSSSLKVGDGIPSFRAADQFGKERDFANLKGPNGLVLLFFRSADW